MLDKTNITKIVPKMESQSLPCRKYGWKKGVVHPDDHIHNFRVTRVQASIPKVDLRPFMPPVYDQGQLGSCTANSIAAAYQFDEIKEKEVSSFTPSRLGIYWNERNKEGTLTEDAGAVIADGMEVIHSVGVFPESPVSNVPSNVVWPYDASKFTVKPPITCFNFAKTHRSAIYRRVVQSLTQLKQALIAGYPIVFGFTVYESFEGQDVASTGLMSMPQSGEQTLGGHAVLMVGFDDSLTTPDGSTGAFIVRNSWGDGWGDKGYFYMPYAYAIDSSLASDFWTLTMVRDT